MIDVDDDADFMPWLALTDRDVGQAGAGVVCYYRHLQWWLFPIVLAGNGFNMGRAGWTLRHCRPAVEMIATSGSSGWISAV